MLKALVGVVFAVAAMAQTADVEKAMRDSEAAWNRGDLETYASYYDDSPQTTFIGREVTRGGTKAILDRYRRGYPTREAMGTLTFSELEVRPLAEGLALMTGRFALKRTAAGGGDSSGRFTLIWKRTAAGWKIIHDHTS
jgi:uncharacterized protein (TIGR02246 family)